ncbi:MAG: hypothetical protein V3T84_15390 [Phycisphaerales bacterium]
MAITIQNERLREGELRFVLELIVIWAFLGGLYVAVPLLGRWGEPPDAQDRWAVAIMVCLPCLIPLLVYIATPRQLLRLDESTVQSVISHWKRYRRFTTRWSDVEQCLLGEQFIGVTAPGQRIALHRRSFAKEDWGLLRAELDAHLTPYFDFDAPTRYDLQRQRQRAWSIWRKVLDKIALVGAVVGLFGPLLLPVAVTSYFGWTESIPVGVIVCVSTIPSIVVLVVVNRYAQRQEHERWHDRRVKPAG